jgi:hypothetical protein
MNLEERSYTLEANETAPQGHVITSTFLMTADLGLQTLSYFNLVIGQIPVAVIDLDGNSNSGPLVHSALTDNGIYAEYKNSMPGDLSNYSTLFVCLGTSDKKHVLSTNEGQKLANFLNAGGRLYMEGGDTWFADPKTAVHPKFKTNGVMDGNGDLSTLTGQNGQFAEELSFSYTGDNEFIDHISPNNPAFCLFKNMMPIYISAVAYDEGTYKTIASSFEFGGLTDGAFPSTKTEYMRRIIEFFGILSMPYTANFMGNPIDICEGENVNFLDFSTAGSTSWNWTFPGGTPETSTEQNPVVTYANPGEYNVTLIVTNGMATDTLVKENYVWVAYCTGTADRNSGEVSFAPNPAKGYTTIYFGKLSVVAGIRVSNASGKNVLEVDNIETSKPFTLQLGNLPSGIYFLTVDSGNTRSVHKLLINR